MPVSQAQNDNGADSNKQGANSKAQAECGTNETKKTSQSDFKILDKNARIEAQDSKRQDFGDKNGALRAEAREHTQAYVTEAEVKQSPFLAQKPTPQEITHTLIIGDNYPALLNLLIRYKNKIKVIYIDPPYGKDDMGQFAETNYHNAITRDNLLSMLYPRLQLARELLKDDGVIFCSIDDRNQAYVKCLFDEVFGEGNFVCNFIWIKNSTKNLSKTTSNNHEYILCYAKNKSEVEQNEGFRLKKPGFDEVKALLARATQEKLSKEQTQKLLKDFYKANKHLKGITSYSSVEFKDGRYQAYTISDISAPKSTGKAATYEILHPLTKKPCKTPATGWRFTRETMDKMIAEGLIEFYESETKVPRVKRFLDSVETEVIKSYIEDFTDGKKELNSIFVECPFDNPKPTTLLKTLLALSTTPEVEEDSESENVGAMDCHDFANAKSRNDEGVDSSKQGEASQSDFKSLEGNVRAEAQDSKAQVESTSKGHSSILDEKCGLQEKGRGSYLEGNDRSTFSPLPHLSLKDECQEPEIILDFFAGSGTTAHAVMELNREDGGKRQCILVTNNEKTELNPQGIAIDVTSKRLKRIMSGECYDGSRDFKWIEKNEPYGGRLEVYEVKAVADTDQNVFKKIDESCYGLRFDSSPKGVQDKIEWVCRNFELTCKSLESNDADSTNKGE